MNKFIEDAQSILLNLKSELLKFREFWVTEQRGNPDFEQPSDGNWEIRQAKCWLHGSTDWSESVELEKWLFCNPLLTDMANEKASECIECWKEWSERESKYYSDFPGFDVEPALKGEILFNYLHRVAALIEEENKESQGLENKMKEIPLKWRSFKAFLDYLRQMPSQACAFIEQIFPKKMGVFFGKIRRTISLEAYPISQEAAADILKELTEMGTTGRPNRYLSALESLGLAWLCLTASRLRLPIYLEAIAKTKISAISTAGAYPTIQIPTFFGPREIRISHRMSQFFLALSKISSNSPRETIFQRNPRVLRDVFEQAVTNCSFIQIKGNITYITLISPPHIFGKYHRYLPS